MKCQKAQALMLDHLYGELGSRREKALLRHLHACDLCSGEFEALKSTTSMFSKLDMEDPPDGLSRTLSAMAKAEAKHRPARAGFGWYWKPALAATAAAALVVISFLYYVPRHETAITAQKQAPAEEPAMLALKKAPADAVGGEASGYREKGAVNALEGAVAGKVSSLELDESLADRHLDREISEEARDIASPMTPAPEPKQKSQELAYNMPMPSSESVRSEITASRQRMDLDKMASAASAPHSQYSAEAKAEGEEVSSLGALYRRGISYQDDEQWKEAVSVYEQIIEKFPDSPLLADVYLSMGDCYREMGKIDEAVRAYETARDRFADQSELAQQKIDAALTQKNTETPAEPPTD